MAVFATKVDSEGLCFKVLITAVAEIHAYTVTEQS